MGSHVHTHHSARVRLSQPAALMLLALVALAVAFILLAAWLVPAAGAAIPV
jgi:hypothetical protein